MHKIGFIGTGNMGGALIKAACKSIGSEKVLVTNRNLEKANKISEETGCGVAKDNLALAKEAEFIVLAVKPDMIRSVCEEIAPALKADKEKEISHVLVTIAAGISTDTVKEKTCNTYPVIRIMPNTPVAVDAGMTLISGTGEEDKYVDEFKGLLSESGDFLNIEEKDIDITTGISGCSPAYAYMFIDALAEGAVRSGVEKDKAIYLASKTLLGAAKMVLESDESPEQLKINVCSPGGSTIEGVKCLEENNFKEIVAQAIMAATKRNLELGK